jgi:predicted dehydrogenase
MMSLTPEERQTGADNWYGAVSAWEQVNRRDFLRRTAAAGGAAAAGIGALWFGYQRPARPLRVAIIGTGDEGSVLIGSLSPDYIEVRAICDIRPSSVHRALHGDWSSPATAAVRPGLMQVYGWPDESTARRQVKVYTDGWQAAITDPDIDAVIIALPLHLHAPVAIAAMQAGKHVLCEKLMAHSVAQSKLMARVAATTGRTLAIGHQRHYNLLYDNAVNLIRWGLLGELHHIRAQWHRNNRPGSDTWAPPLPGGELVAGGKKRIDPIAEELDGLRAALRDPATSGSERLVLKKKIAQWQAWDADQTVEAARHGYQADTSIYRDGRERTPLEELVRWRLWDRTGGGLMAELGSHQLDAAGIFVSALSREKGHKVHPLTVHAIGGRHLFAPDREAEDHVYCLFEYPGQGYDYDFDVGYRDPVNNLPDPAQGVPGYVNDNEKKVVVTYSSINGNGFGGYGEVVMGTKATLVLDREQEAMLYPLQGTSASAGVRHRDGKAPVLDTTASGDVATAKAAEAGYVSRGYREEIEHWAWCIQTGDPANQPRCNGPQALADAVIALTAKLAIRNSRDGKPGFIRFRKEWFEVDDDLVPEAESLASAQELFAGERRNLGLS